MYVINHLDYIFTQSNIHSGHIHSGNDKKIGIVGHSLGGAAAFEVAKRDSRILAGVLLDASFHLIDIDEHETISTPILMMRQENCTYDELCNDLSEELLSRYINGFAKIYHQLVGFKNTVKVQGAHHMTFSDVPLHYKDMDVFEKHKSISKYTSIFFEEFIQAKAFSFQNVCKSKLFADIVDIDYEGNIMAPCQQYQ